MKKYLSHSLGETKEIASELVGSFQKYDDQATIVALSGHLGAGKTAFVKQVAKVLGVTEEITSPTFVIMKMYEIVGVFPWSRLVHIDAYRLEKMEELDVLDWEGLVSNTGNLIMIEWPENVGLVGVDHDKDRNENLNLFRLRFEGKNEGYEIEVI